VGGGYYFADGPYVAFTAWPGMNMSVTGDGWLGINPTGQRITMRSLDFWRVERGLIRENWVLVDMLHVWKQLGVDVIARAVEMCSQLEHDENYR
jgi:predicted ester cyclase